MSKRGKDDEDDASSSQPAQGNKVATTSEGTRTQDENGDAGPPSKKPRRRYDNNLKAQILDELKKPGATLPEVAKRHGIPENTVRDWTKVSAVKAIEAAREKSGGGLKANLAKDPLRHLADTLIIYFNRNRSQPDGESRLPITTKLIQVKGRQARTKLLQMHEKKPFLEPKELKALELFSGSESWAKKFARRHNLKLTGTRFKDLPNEVVDKYIEEIKQMANDIEKAGPAYLEVSSLLRQATKKLGAVHQSNTKAQKPPSATTGAET